MQINNNPTSFRGVTITDSAMVELSRRMPSGKFSVGLEKFKSLYKNSPVKMIIDTFEPMNPRLDARIYYEKQGKKDFTYFMENAFSYFLDLNPEGFLKKAGNELKRMEIELGLIK